MMLSLVNLSLVTEKRFSHRHYEKKTVSGLLLDSAERTNVGQ